MKICTKCKEIKEDRDFGRDKRNKNGLQSRCKNCCKMDKRERNGYRYEIYTDEYKEKRKKEARCYQKEYLKTYRKTEKYKKYAREYKKILYKSKKNILKIKCRGKLNNKIYSGKIKKLPCEICGALNVEAHHEDYNKPCDVRWLCVKHHKQLHYTIKI